MDGLESDAISAALKSIRSLCILGLIQNSQYMTQTEKKMSTRGPGNHEKNSICAVHIYGTCLNLTVRFSEYAICTEKPGGKQNGTNPLKLLKVAPPVQPLSHTFLQEPGARDKSEYILHKNQLNDW